MKQVFNVDSVDFVDMTATLRSTEQNCPSLRFAISREAAEALVGAAQRMLVEIDIATGQLTSAERIKEEVVKAVKTPRETHEEPMIIQPLNTKEMSKRGIKTTTMASIVRPLLGEYKECGNQTMMKVISKIVFPRLEELGLITKLHDRVHENGRPAKCRYFTKEGAKYGQAKSYATDYAKKKTITTGYQFYENKKNEIIELLGKETIDSAIVAAKLIEG